MQKEELKAFARWLQSLNPTEFMLLSTITSIILAELLDTNEQNSIGNWLESVGQNLLTISAQEYLITANQPSIEQIKLNKLEKEIEQLKSNLQNSSNS